MRYEKSLAYIAFFVTITLLSSAVFLANIISISYSQTTADPQSSAPASEVPMTSLGVKITKPANNQEFSLQNTKNESLQVIGTSTDNTNAECQVSVIANDVRPYQNTTPTGQDGKDDYSAWTYSLGPNLIKEGSNKITARILCVSHSDIVPASNSTANLVKHSSIFFTILSTPTATAVVDDPINTNASNTSKILTTTTTTSTSTRTSAVPYFVSKPNCQVNESSHDLNCIIKIAGIENIAKIQPFLHADLTTSCVNPAGNTPPDKVRTIPLIGDSKTIRAVVDVNCPPSMTPSFTYKNVKIQVGDVLLSIPGTFTSE